VARLPVGGDRGHPDGAVLVADVVRLLDHPCTLDAGVRDAAVDVRDLQRDVDDSVAVLAVVVQQRALGVNAALDHEPAGPAAQHERLVVPVPFSGPEYATSSMPKADW
jgi:hypothetical protein